jgi:sphingomyelin phosphodiesterase acid-like 3
MRGVFGMRRMFLGGLIAVFYVVLVGSLRAQTAKRPEAVEISALMVSDVHFDPFHDPGKARRLAEASEGEWNGILAGADSSDQAEAFEGLQKSCGGRGVDTPYALLQSSLRAMKAAAPEAKFALVSGDLVVHGFGCRYKALLPDKTEADYAAFVEKTVRYVVGQMRLSLVGMPVYVGLGNNDSACGDYAMAPGDGFLTATKELMVDGLVAPGEKSAALASYEAGGNYSVKMKGAMKGTRLIVLDDLFQSRRYSACGKGPDGVAAEAEIDWLKGELAKAREAKEKVWVMGHIPAGIDPFSTFSKFTDVCIGEAPVMFLGSEKMADVMGEYADVIRLGVFGHTHMDEMRLFGKDGGGVADKVAIKMVPSISPVDGNDPSFTVARVNPATAQMVDYEVIAGSNKTGVDTVWQKEYSFGKTYHEKVFSPVTVGKLLGEFGTDLDARGEMSRAYLTNYFVGDKSLLLKSLWPNYVCAMGNHTEKGFAGCVCAAGK